MHRYDLHQRADPDSDAAWHGGTALKPTLAIVGAGKVGAVLARLLFARGYSIATIYSRSYSHARDLAQVVGAQAVESYGEVAGDLVLLTVPDDAIEAVAAALVGFGGRAAVHTSGARDASALVSLAGQEIAVGSLHPIYPFADVETALVRLPGAAFAVEAEDAGLMDWLRGMVAALEGRAFVIPAGKKALYHAALVIMSNYTVTLFALSSDLLVQLGIDPQDAFFSLLGLLGGAYENIWSDGIPDALTGPLVRADTGTIKAHLEALNGVNSSVREVYIQLARLTFPLLEARGVALDGIEAVLKDVEDAHHSA